MQVDSAPHIAGLRFRAFQGTDDYPAMARVRESAGVWDRVDPHLSDMALRDLSLLSDAALPPGLETRPALPEHYPAIYRAWKETWSGIPLTTAPSDEDYKEFLDDNVHVPGFDPALWRVAWDGNEVAGFVFRRLRRGAGIIPEVAVRPAWRRRGLARALLVQGLRGQHERGVTEARIITNANDEQGARSLYESVGFREAKRHGVYRKPLSDSSR